MSAYSLRTRSAHNCGAAPQACASGREGKGREGISSKTKCLRNWSARDFGLGRQER